MEQKAKFKLTWIEISVMSGILILFLCEVFKHYTRWDERTCLVLAVFPILTAQNLLFEPTARKKMFREIQILAIMAGIYVMFGLCMRALN